MDSKCTEKNSYNGIDACKFVMALCVIAIHTEPLTGCKNQVILSMYQSAVNLAVPFFFLATGFFLGKKMSRDFSSQRDLEIVKTSLWRMLRWYLVWSAVYFPLALCEYQRGGYTPVTFAVTYVVKLFLVGEHYNSWMLWYLLAAVYALGALCLLLKRKVSIRKIVLLATLIILVIFGINAFVNVKGEETFSEAVVKGVSALRIFTGFFYITIGMLLAKREIPRRIHMGLFVAGVLLGCCVDGRACSMPAALGAMGLFGLMKDAGWNDHPVYGILRQMSTDLYFLHLYVWTVYYELHYGEKTFGLDSFLIVSVVCMLLSVVHIAWKNNRKMKS